MQKKDDNARITASQCQSRSNKLSQSDNSFLAYLHDFVWLLAIILLTFLFAFRVVVVSGPSMTSTLLDGDYLLLVNNIFCDEPERGDIVVASIEKFRTGESIVKRVIATEGQVVDIDFEQGVVYVDGVALDEPYANTPTNLRGDITFPLTVTQGCVFVMGDNRNVSLDSRDSQIGLIDTREIVGKVILIFFPGTDEGNQPRDFSRIGVLS